MKAFGNDLKGRITAALKKSEDYSRKKPNVHTLQKESGFSKFERSLETKHGIENILLNKQRQYNKIFNSLKSNVMNHSYSIFKDEEHSKTPTIKAKINDVSDEGIRFSTEHKASIDDYSLRSIIK